MLIQYIRLLNEKIEDQGKKLDDEKQNSKRERENAIFQSESRKKTEVLIKSKEDLIERLQGDINKNQEENQNLGKKLDQECSTTIGLQETLAHLETERDNLKEEMSQLSATLKEKDQQLLDHQRLMQAKDLESHDTISQLKQELQKQLEDSKSKFDIFQEERRLAYTNLQDETSKAFTQLQQDSSREIADLRQKNQVLPRDFRTPSATWRAEFAISRQASNRRLTL